MFSIASLPAHPNRVSPLVSAQFTIYSSLMDQSSTSYDDPTNMWGSFMGASNIQPPSLFFQSDSDRQRVAEVVQTMRQERHFIVTDIQSDMIWDDTTSSPDPQQHPGPTAQASHSSNTPFTLPGSEPFRFGDDLGTDFCFPSFLGDDLFAYPAPQRGPGQDTLLPPGSSADYGSMSTPVPSRPSSPPLSAPLLAVSSDYLRISHQLHHNSGGQPSNRQLNEPVSIPIPESFTPSQTVSSEAREEVVAAVAEAHAYTLDRTVNRAALLGIAGTFNDVAAASEFIVSYPDSRLEGPLGDLFNDIWHEVGARSGYSDPAAIREEVSRRFGTFVTSDPAMHANTKQGQRQLGAYLKDMFCYVFDVLLGSRDHELLRIKSDGDPDIAKDKINTVASTMAYAHSAEYVEYQKKAQPVTLYTHPEVADFRRKVSVSDTFRAVTVLHHYKAYKRLCDRRAKLLRGGKLWMPTPTQSLLLDKPPSTRFSSTSPNLLRVLMPGGLKEVYFLNFQDHFVLNSARYSYERVHRSSSGSGEDSVVLRYFNQQRALPPWSPLDTVWRTLIIPMASSAAGLFVARENIDDYLQGVSGAIALEATPKAALVFQAKILAVEKVLLHWVTSKHSRVEYPLLRHRLLEIMADVVRPGDDYIGYDLVGPIWAASDADHIAYDQSFTTRDHTVKHFVEPLVTRAPTILESSYLVSSRSKEAVATLLSENSGAA